MSESPWPVVAMADVMAEFYDGPHATPAPADDGPVYLGIKNLSESGHLDLSKVRHIAESDFANWTRRVEPRPGDIVFTYEATLHRYAIIPDGFRGTLGRRIALIRPDESKIDRRYLHFYLLSSQWRRTIEQRINVGSTVDRIPLTEFPDYPVPLPPLPHQRAVVAALGAIDDLIENNRGRVEVLEEMARLTYREWFVHFRFPGHEHVELVDSALGPVPEGWATATLSDIASYINRGVAPKYDEDSPSLVINQRCIRDHRATLDVARRHITKVSKDKLVRMGDVLINSTGVGTLGRVAPLRVDLHDTTVDSHVTIVRPHPEVNVDYFAELVLSLEPLFESMGVGSTGQTELSRARVGEAPVVVAPKLVRDSFGDFASPMSALVANLIGQNDVLARARDFLLPRLISGQLDVSDLDLGLEPVA